MSLNASHAPLNPMPLLPPTFTIPAVVETERFRMRSITIHDAFKRCDAVMSLDESRVPGRAYIDPPHESVTHADIWFWARQSELSTALEDHLSQFVASWLASAWPFRKVTMSGQLRTIKPSPAADPSIDATQPTP